MDCVALCLTERGGSKPSDGIPYCQLLGGLNPLRPINAQSGLAKKRICFASPYGMMFHFLRGNVGLNSGCLQKKDKFMRCEYLIAMEVGRCLSRPHFHTRYHDMHRSIHFDVIGQLKLNICARPLLIFTILTSSGKDMVGIKSSP